MKLPPFMTAGYHVTTGSHKFEEAEILRFARKYDPQRFHVDPQAARESVLGGLCASGWHTASIWMKCQREQTRAMIDELPLSGFGAVEYGPSPGVEELKWPKPVFVGDTVTYFNETSECRASKSRPGWYILNGLAGGHNQHGQLVLSFNSHVFLRYEARVSK